MIELVGISGSLRRNSYNTALLRAAAALAPEGTHVEIASIREFPLYDGDIEAAGIPEPVQQLKDRIAASHGLLLVTPEYNHSIPGVLKNAIDWLTRPAADVPRVFRDRPVAIIGATTGRGSTALAQAAWLPVLQTLATRPWFGGGVQISSAKQVFDGSGQLVDEDVRSRLQSFMAGFAEFAARNRA